VHIPPHRAVIGIQGIIAPIAAHIRFTVREKGHKPLYVATTNGTYEFENHFYLSLFE